MRGTEDSAHKPMPPSAGAGGKIGHHVCDRDYRRGRLGHPASAGVVGLRSLFVGYVGADPNIGEAPS